MTLPTTKAKLHSLKICIFNDGKIEIYWLVKPYLLVINFITAIHHNDNTVHITTNIIITSYVVGYLALRHSSVNN